MINIEALSSCSTCCLNFTGQPCLFGNFLWKRTLLPLLDRFLRRPIRRSSGICIYAGFYLVFGIYRSNKRLICRSTRISTHRLCCKIRSKCRFQIEYSIFFKAQVARRPSIRLLEWRLLGFLVARLYPPLEGATRACIQRFCNYHIEIWPLKIIIRLFFRGLVSISLLFVKKFGFGIGKWSI